MTPRAEWLQQLHRHTKQFIDAWTRPRSPAEVQLPPLSASASISDGTFAENEVRRYLRVFLLRLFGSEEALKREELPEELRSPFEMTRCPEWVRVRGIALNVWVPSGIFEGDGHVRFFADHRVLNSQEESSLRCTFSAGHDLHGPEDPRVLWTYGAHVPYFALTKALERRGLSTVVAYLAREEKRLKLDSPFGLSFRPSKREETGGDLMLVPERLSGCGASALGAERTFRFAVLKALERRSWPVGKALEAVAYGDLVDAADRYVRESLPPTWEDPGRRREGAFAAWLERKSAEQATGELCGALGERIFRDAQPAEVSQVSAMLPILYRFYMGPRAGNFYTRPIFSIAKPGDGPRRCGLSTVGITTAGALSPEMLEGLERAFQMLISPIQTGDYARQREAEAHHFKRRLWGSTAHFLKSVTTKVVLPPAEIQTARGLNLLLVHVRAVDAMARNAGIGEDEMLTWVSGGAVAGDLAESLGESILGYFPRGPREIVGEAAVPSCDIRLAALLVNLAENMDKHQYAPWKRGRLLLATNPHDPAFVDVEAEAFVRRIDMDGLRGRVQDLSRPKGGERVRGIEIILHLVRALGGSSIQWSFVPASGELEAPPVQEVTREGVLLRFVDHTTKESEPPFTMRFSVKALGGVGRGGN